MAATRIVRFLALAMLLGIMIQTMEIRGDMGGMNGDMGDMNGDMGDMGGGSMGQGNMNGNMGGGTMGQGNMSGDMGNMNGRDPAQPMSMSDGLTMILSLPVETQKQVLKSYGHSLVQEGTVACNPFGGNESCVQIQQESGFAKVCPHANLMVDCAYEKAAFRAAMHNPDHVLQKLTKEGYQRCDQCQTALHKLWCAQTSPKCGTFELVFSEILDAVRAIVTDKVPEDQALQKAIPKLLKARSLNYPCKDMCVAVTQSCSCGKAATFGEVMEVIERKQHRGEAGGNVVGDVGPYSVRNTFTEVWNMPVCDLFAERSTPGFAGVCDVDDRVARCGWCGTAGEPKALEELIVEEIALSVSGMLASGVQDLLDKEAGRDSSMDLSDQFSSGRRNKGGHGAVIGIVLTLILMLTAIGVGVAILFHYRRRKVPTHHYVDLSRMGYTPPVL